MADPRTLPTPQLFKAWRSGDAAAGGVMAQRFSDWYYAITATRLGDQHGRAPLQRACLRFQQGIVSVSNPATLADWAHGLLLEELQQAGGRLAGGDFPNALTGGRSPTELLQRAAAELPPAQVRLLAHAYDARYPAEDLAHEAEALGGMPVAVLQARHALKRWLRDQVAVPFTEVPEEPNLDCAPLPVYEASRMASAAEEAGFEKWLLSDMGLCKDIAEFGVFAMALRAGAFAEAPAPRAPTGAPTRAPTLAPPSFPATAAPAGAPPAAAGVRTAAVSSEPPPTGASPGRKLLPVIIVAGVIAVALLAAVVVALVQVLG